MDIINNNNDDHLLIYGNADICDDIFLTLVNGTKINLLTGATCAFTENSNQVENVDIIISLSSLSTITPNDSKVLVFIQTGSFYYHRIEDDFRNSYMFNDSALSFNPLSAQNTMQPIISVRFASTIGSCDSIYIDARNTAMLGGRSANYTWIARNSYPNHTNTHLAFPLLSGLDENILSNVNIDVLSTVEIQLIVESWFGGQSSALFNISKENDTLPVLVLRATPNTFTKSNKNYDKIAITSLITFNNSCVNDNDAISVLQYSLKWSVSTAATNTVHLNTLQKYLETLTDDSIFIPSTYMLPGNSYIFKLELDCKNCVSVSSSVAVDYDYSNIQCQIGSSGNILLEGISIKQMKSFTLKLDGDTFTFDYDQPSISDKSNLVWKWACEKKASNEIATNCDNLLVESGSEQLIIFDSETFVANETYLYQFQMVVSDAHTLSRMQCKDSVTLVVDIIPNTEETNNINILSVSISAVLQTINVNEKLRLIIDVGNWNQNGERAHFNWTEITNLLPIKNINKLNENRENNGFLILPENTLLSGQRYEFDLFVTEYNDDHEIIAYGSSSIQIYVNIPPIIHDDSFIISPDCYVEYSSLSQLFTTFYYLSIEADSDNLPLSYQFSYVYNGKKYMLHPSLLSQSFLTNILLPIGDFTVIADVFDSTSTRIIESKLCRISLMESATTECTSFTPIFKTHLREINTQSSNEIISYLFQSAQLYIDFILQHDDYPIHDQCVESIINEIIGNLYNYVIDNEELINLNICNIDYSILLSQTLLSLVTLQEKHSYFDDVNNQKQFELLSVALDPCYAIAEIEDLNDLSLDTDSIISNTPALYYNKNNIITLIPNIIRNFDTSISSLFYAYISSSITLIEQFNDNEEYKTDVFALFNLLYSSLYIHTLLQISISIPGEQLSINEHGVSIFTIRVSTDIHESLNISIHDIDIEFDNNLFKNDKCKQNKKISDAKLCSVDIVTLPVNFTNEQIQIEKTNTICNKEQFEVLNSTLSDASDAVSIQIIGSDFNVSSLPSNVSITFNFNSTTDLNQLRCAWLDEISNTWSYKGCQQYIDFDKSLIHCSCNHLTTFGTVRDIQSANDNILCSLFDTKEWKFVHFIFFILFGIVFCYLLLQLLPFIMTGKCSIFTSNIQLFILIFAALVCIFNMTTCFMIFFIESIQWDEISVVFLTTFMLIPLIFYFMMFSSILLTWIIVAKSMKSNATSMMKKVTKLLISLNIFYCLLLSAQIALLVMDLGNAQIYLLFEIIWSFSMFLAGIYFGIYGYRMVKIIVVTAKMINIMHASAPSNVSSTSRSTSSTLPTGPNTTEEFQLAKKLGFIAGVIIVFFLTQCLVALYFLSGFGISKISIEWRIIDLSSHLLCLIIICFMYNKALKMLRLRLNIKLCPCLKVKSSARIKKKTIGDSDMSSNSANSDPDNTLNQTDLNSSSPKQANIITSSSSPPASVQKSVVETGHIELQSIE